MAATTYTINGSSPTAVLEFARPNDVFLQNLSTADTVWLDNSRGVTATSGAPLGAGASKVWTAGMPLFAVAGAGKTVPLCMSDNSGAIVDPSTIAAQILQQGLATSIAQAIYVTGVPPVDRLTDIVPGGGPNSGTMDSGVGFVGPVMDCSAFPSLLLYITDGFVNDSAKMRQIVVRWFADAAGTLPIGTEDWFIPIINGEMSVSVPTRGRSVQFEALALTTATQDAINFWVFGSYRSVPKARFIIENTATDTMTVQVASESITQWAGNASATSSVTGYPKVTAGPGRLTARIGPITTAGEMTLLSFQGTRMATWPLPVSAGVTIIDADVDFPIAPVKITLANNNVAVLSYTVAVTEVGEL